MGFSRSPPPTWAGCVHSGRQLPKVSPTSAWGCHLPGSFRPRRSSRPRRFTPHPDLQVCCALQPAMGFATFPARTRSGPGVRPCAGWSVFPPSPASGLGPRGPAAVSTSPGRLRRAPGSPPRRISRVATLLPVLRRAVPSRASQVHVAVGPWLPPTASPRSVWPSDRYRYRPGMTTGRSSSLRRCLSLWRITLRSVLLAGSRAASPRSLPSRRSSRSGRSPCALPRCGTALDEVGLRAFLHRRVRGFAWRCHPA